MKQQVPQKLHKRISKLNFLSRREIAELPNLLMPDEQVLGVVSGFYATGPATLCVTSKRLLLIDKKLVRLNIEDVRYDSISEVNYSHQAIMASVKFYVAGRELPFKSWYKRELRILAHFVQHKIHTAAAAAADTASSESIATSVPLQQPAPFYQSSPEMEQYLSERIARWRRANKFIENLPKPIESQALEQPY